MSHAFTFRTSYEAVCVHKWSVCVEAFFQLPDIFFSALLSQKSIGFIHSNFTVFCFLILNLRWDRCVIISQATCTRWAWPITYPFKWLPMSCPWPTHREQPTNGEWAVYTMGRFCHKSANFIGLPMDLPINFSTHMGRRKLAVYTMGR